MKHCSALIYVPIGGEIASYWLNNFLEYIATFPPLLAKLQNENLAILNTLTRVKSFGLLGKITK